MNIRTARVALAAVVVLVVLGGVTFWPSGHADQWWLGSPAVWGREISRSLERVKVLSYQEGCVFVGNYGSTHTSGNWSRWYKAADRLRRDTYYNDTLVSTMWEVPDAPGSILRYDVSYEFGCYTIQTYASGPGASDPNVSDPGASDPVDMLRFYVNLLERADRILEPATFEGKECVGFEISVSTYNAGSPKEWIDRIWFDKLTRLPVRIEKHGLPVTDHPEETFTFVQERFEYAGEVPADLLEPVIPDGFVNAHPDTIRQARERQEKGEMVFASVPDGLKDDVFAAFRRVEAVAYIEGGVQVYASRSAWRRDRLDEDRVRTTEWYVIQKDDEAPTNLDFNDKSFRIVQTIVDYDAHTFRQIEHRETTWLGHPMDRFAFIIGLIDRADRFQESAQIDGVECFGFDVSAKKYGTNPEGAFHRIWLESATNLPVRIERHWPDSHSAEVHVLVQERFAWDPVLPEGVFIPQIPPDFAKAED